MEGGPGTCPLDLCYFTKGNKCEWVGEVEARGKGKIVRRGQDDYFRGRTFM